MGIETYELLARVEEEFGVPNAFNGKADTFETVGDLHRYILLHRRPRPPVACLTAATFRRVRRGFGAVFGLPRDRLRPDSRVEDLLPRASRRLSWSRLEDCIGLRLPSLDPPSRVLKWCLILSLITWPLPFSIVLAASGIVPAMFFTVLPFPYPIIAAMLAMILLLALTPLHTEPPQGCETISGLTRAIVKETYGEQALRKDRWDDRDVWEDLVSLIEEWGISRGRISAKTRFVADLGAYTL
ncbi:hypothetical protein [Aquisphaera insulae]|uniref:hypothetical protein n=1 Tax=Aquisphaera insulae TaxID=2712864 RepID=UPI0013EB735A|nr:hypothetical protein [Aquisphaera insulae]